MVTGSGFKTILGGDGSPESPEEKAQREEADFIRSRMRALVWTLCDSYTDGELTLERLCRFAVRVTDISRKNPYVAGGLDRQRLLGAMLEKAMASTPPRRGRGNYGSPTRIREMVRETVKLIQAREGLPTNRASSEGLDRGGAYSRARALLASAGIAVTASQIEEWAYPRKRKNQRKKIPSVRKIKTPDAR